MLENVGVTADEAAEAFVKFQKAVRSLGLPGEKEIELIKRNPNLRLLQKLRLIHFLKTLDKN